MMMGLAPRLGLPPAGFNALGWGLQIARQEQGGLRLVMKELRASIGWREWLRTFFQAVANSAGLAVMTGLAARDLNLDHQELIKTWVRAPRHPIRLLELLLARPVLDLPTVAEELEVTQRTAGLLVDKLKGLGLLRETTGQRRGRRYAYDPLIELLDQAGREESPEAAD
jgi:hypothetical protein